MDDDGRTELHRAVVDRDLHAVGDILNSDSDILLKKDTIGLTALHLSCLLGDIEITKKLLEHTPSSTPLSSLSNNSGRTPLHCAIAKQRYTLVPMLLEWRPQLIRASDNNRWTALHVAAAVGAPDSVLRELVEAGADLRDTNSEGLTAGVIATQDENKQVVKFLLEVGREIKYRWWQEAINDTGICAVDFVKSAEMNAVYRLFLESKQKQV